MRTIHENGENMILLTQDEYEDLVDARDHEAAMRDVRHGAMPLIPLEDITEATRAPLRYWRRRAALTQVALAERAGISQAYLAQIESGARVGDVRTTRALARALGVRMEDLVSE